jgi:hypothetical protein
VAEEALADAVEVGLTGTVEELSSRGGDGCQEAPGVVGTALAAQQPVALQPVDQAREPAAAEQHAVGQLRHAQLTTRGVGEEQQHLVGGQRQVVLAQQLGVERASQARMNPKQAAPGA